MAEEDSDVRWLKDGWFRFRALFDRTEMRAELDDEISFHLEMEARKLQGEGFSPEEAHRLARVRFGGPERFREQAEESWGVAPLLGIAGDIRFAARQLLRRPAFTFLAVLTLALGIGGTVALFSVVDGLLIRPLPYAQEDRLVTFWADYDWRGTEYDFVREHADAYQALAAYSDDASTLHTSSGSRLMLYSVGSSTLFDVLGARPMLGRTFEDGEDRPGAEPVIVLGYDLWEREFGADRDVLGSRVDLGGTLRTVVGVMPEGFWFPSPESEAWIPLDLDPASQNYNSNGWLVLMGRLDDGVAPEHVDDDLARLSAALSDEYDYPVAWDKSKNPFVLSTRDYLLGDVRPALLLLLGAVGLVLLMSCANVAALLVTRTGDRLGEMSVRAALGAGRVRLARQLLTESVLLGVIAGLFGMGLAVAAFDVLVASLPLPRDLGDTLHLDWTVLTASLLLAVVAGSVVSLGPMHGLARGRFGSGTFGTRAATGSTGGRSRLQRSLVIGEVLIAVVLATGASLLIRTVGELRDIDWGLNPEGVLTADLMLPEAGNVDARPAFYDAVLERVGALPGVLAVGMINRIPVRDGGWQGGVSVAGRPDLEGENRPGAYFRPLSPGTMTALGIEVVAGRGILDSDGTNGPRVAVVNQAFARSIFGSEDAVGQRLEGNQFTNESIEIVGVIRDVAVDDLTGAVPPAVYYPWDQSLSRSAYGILVVKTSLDPLALTAPVRRIVGEQNSRATVGRVETMDQVVDTSMAEPLRLRFFLALFSALGIVLGMVGVYGVVTQAVQRRRAEFGIRMALGASPSDLLGEVVRQGMVPVVLGVIAGGIAAMAGSAVLAGFLFGVEPTDGVSLAASAATLLLVGVAASFVPAWRASGTDPAVALRER